MAADDEWTVAYVLDLRLYGSDWDTVIVGIRGDSGLPGPTLSDIQLSVEFCSLFEQEAMNGNSETWPTVRENGQSHLIVFL